MNVEVIGWGSLIWCVGSHGSRHTGDLIDLSCAGRKPDLPGIGRGDVDYRRGPRRLLLDVPRLPIGGSVLAAESLT